MDIVSQMVSSTITYSKLALSGSLHLKTSRLGSLYKVSDGKTYAIFRETVSDKEYGKQEVTLIIGFRLIIIGSNPFFHWLFQTLCILDTPVWVGFRGFQTKFWMVELNSKDYLGLYRYQGKENAKQYADYITAVLKPVSTEGSVWYEVINMPFEKYVNAHKISVK